MWNTPSGRVQQTVDNALGTAPLIIGHVKLPEHSWASDTDHIFTSAAGSGDHTTGTGTHNGWFTDLLTNIDVRLHPHGRISDPG